MQIVQLYEWCLIFPRAVKWIFLLLMGLIKVTRVVFNNSRMAALGGKGLRAHLLFSNACQPYVSHVEPQRNKQLGEFMAKILSLHASFIPQDIIYLEGKEIPPERKLTKMWKKLLVLYRLYFEIKSRKSNYH